MKTYKNPISTAMSEYREDFHYNKEWWMERMGTGNNNEYLWIQFKNGDNITVQSDYFQYGGNTCLPRFRADEVAYISRCYGDQVETTTAANIVVDTDRIILYRDGVEYFRYEMTEEEFKEMRRQIWELDDDTDPTTWKLDYCRTLATSKMNNNTTTTEPTNTPSTMNAKETISTAIIAELNTRKDRSAWNKGVTEYAIELAESLDNWDKQPEGVAELREMMLNGADDWKAYSWGGSSLIYNQDIAERLCSPSELKRVTNKNGLRDYPNSREHWLDVQARALYQAANLVATIANKFFNAPQTDASSQPDIRR